MKNYLAYAALAIIFSVAPAYAEDWNVVTDIDNGGQLLADKDILRAEKVNDGTKDDWIIDTVFSVRDNPGFKNSVTIKVYIARNPCLQNHNGKIVLVPSDTKEKHQFFWEEHGTRIFDAMGQYLCGRVFGMEGLDVKKFYNPPPPMIEKLQPKPKPNSDSSEKEENEDEL